MRTASAPQFAVVDRSLSAKSEASARVSDPFPYHRAECLTTSGEYDNNGARLWSGKLRPLQRFRLDTCGPRGI
jgi:hypothetical protein